MPINIITIKYGNWLPWVAFPQFLYLCGDRRGRRHELDPAKPSLYFPNNPRYTCPQFQQEWPRTGRSEGCPSDNHNGTHKLDSRWPEHLATTSPDPSILPLGIDRTEWGLRLLASFTLQSLSIQCAHWSHVIHGDFSSLPVQALTYQRVTTHNKTHSKTRNEARSETHNKTHQAEQCHNMYTKLTHPISSYFSDCFQTRGIAQETMTHHLYKLSIAFPWPNFLDLRQFMHHFWTKTKRLNTPWTGPSKMFFSNCKRNLALSWLQIKKLF